MPLADAIWRTNHAMHPTVMRTQEPLFNDTTFRYELLHKMFTQAEADQVRIDDKHAVEIAATLGIKGPDFLSCNANQFEHGSNVLSAVYVPSAARAWVAWEDGTADQWRPAACNTYVRFDFDQWWNH